jgi:hypothetical protein
MGYPDVAAATRNITALTEPRNTPDERYSSSPQSHDETTHTEPEAAPKRKE